MEKKKYNKDDFRFLSNASVKLNGLVGPGAQNLEEKDLSKGRDFEGVAYSGEVIPQHGFFQNLYIDMDTMVWKEEIPIFFNHDPDRIVGKATLKQDGKLKIKGKIFNNSYGKEVQELADHDLALELSVGAMPGKIEELGQGLTRMINGFEVEGPATILINTRIYETSIVPVGADANTNVTIFSSGSKIEVEFNKLTKREENMELTQELVSQFEFGCSCGEKKSVAQMDKELAELKEELKKYKSKEKKEAAQEKAAELGIKATDEILELLMDEEKSMIFTAALSAEKIEVETEVQSAVEEENKETELALEKVKEALEKPLVFEKNAAELSKESSPQDFILAAKKMVKEGKAANFDQAMVSLAKI